MGGRVARGVAGSGSECLYLGATVPVGAVSHCGECAAGLGKVCAGTLFGSAFCAGSSPDSAGGMPEAEEAGSGRGKTSGNHEAQPDKG